MLPSPKSSMFNKLCENKVLRKPILSYLCCFVTKVTNNIPYSMILVPPDIFFDGGSDFDGPRGLKPGFLHCSLKKNKSSSVNKNKFCENQSQPMFVFLSVNDMKHTSFSMIPVPSDTVFDGGSEFHGPEA